MSVNRARVHAHLKMAQEELQDSSRIHEPFSLRLGYQAVWTMAQTALDMLDALPSEEFCRHAEQPGPTEPLAAAEAHNATLCLRTLVGQGTDTWDPLCTLLKGHDGACKSVAALRGGGMS